MRISDWSSDVCSSDLENTIVIFMSDHGEMLGDHGIYLKGPYFYEPAVRVPLIVSWPGTIAGGRSVPEMVELVDLAPTLLAAAGLRSEEHTSELQSLMRISYAVFCLKTKIKRTNLTMISR